ncbi:MAG: 16S rRNA (uracil(1498)-N(3))-methyltransferase [gamma proteobacterium symbiont of Bathyaustriella thionipta]|nr:16S rRNA (uracil(1498)-N(3))-methyltransferase [gamma proteobacterium symbiont of Bathyaustriella thionipta]
MRLNHLYCPHAKAAYSRITLDKRRSRHLLSVLRARKGMPLVIFNGLGQRYAATLLNEHTTHAEIELAEALPEQKQAAAKITLIQGLARNDRMDLIIQKATELGVHRIVPVFTRNSRIKLDARRSQKRLDHWQEITISACEQSQRARLPLIEAPQELAHYLSHEKPAYGFVFAIGDYPTLNTFSTPQAEIQLLIGPESGLHEDEMDLAVHCGLNKSRLGSQVLRTETAALAAISSVQTLWGDFRIR